MTVKTPHFEITKISDTEYEATTIINKELEWLEGHFPSFSILPGVAMISFVVELSSKVFNLALNEALLNFDSIKFTKPILDNTAVTFKLTHISEKKTITFKILESENLEITNATGKFKYEFKEE